MRWLFWATFSETMGHTDYVSSFIPFPQGVLWGKKKKRGQNNLYHEAVVDSPQLQ